MINTEIVLWAPPCQNLRGPPPLRFWHGATRGLNPALRTIVSLQYRQPTILFDNASVSCEYFVSTNADAVMIRLAKILQCRLKQQALALSVEFVRSDVIFFYIYVS